MAESVLFCTCAMCAGGGCAPALAGLAPDFMATAPVTVTAARTAVAVSTHLFRLTA
jgi:hypothetical protein